jgi:hypothetical protein
MLHNIEELVKEGQAVKIDKIKAIFRSKDSLSNKVFALKHSGSTGLGPALAVAVGLASQQRSSEISKSSVRSEN